MTFAHTYVCQINVEVKLFLCTPWRHMGEWMCNSTHSYPRLHECEQSTSFPDASLLGEKPAVSSEQGTG